MYSDSSSSRCIQVNHRQIPSFLRKLHCVKLGFHVCSVASWLLLTASEVHLAFYRMLQLLRPWMTASLLMGKSGAARSSLPSSLASCSTWWSKPRLALLYCLDPLEEVCAARHCTSPYYTAHMCDHWVNTVTEPSTCLLAIDQ